jgi:hypothetical protein
MEYPEGGAAKRRVLVDALTMVLERSQVAQHVDAPTLRSVLDMAGGELFREGEVRLEYVWKILCQQPGLSAKEVAPPMLVFKAYEEELGIAVRLPAALSAVPRGEQLKLRDQLGISQEDFSKVVGELNQLAAAEQAEQAKQKAAAVEARKTEAATEAPRVAKPEAAPAKKPMNAKVAAAILAVSVAISGVILFFSFHETVTSVDFGGASLKLSDGRREGSSVIAKVSDPRWDSLPQDEKQKLVGEVMDAQVANGVKVLTLRDESGRVRATATDTAAGRVVNVN